MFPKYSTKHQINNIAALKHPRYMFMTQELFTAMECKLNLLATIELKGIFLFDHFSYATGGDVLCRYNTLRKRMSVLQPRPS